MHLFIICGNFELRSFFAEKIAIHMEVDVGGYIAELLYEHDIVNLPGLGSFTGKYQSANIDHVQGKLYPPAKELTFNTNLVLDDGVLVQYIQQKHLLSFEEANRVVDEFVRNVREALKNKEIVVFPKLGRIFKDYEGHLKFIAEGSNFNTDSFGLPAVQFFPIRRLEEQLGRTNNQKIREEKVVAPKNTDWQKKLIAWFDRNILYFIGATTIFIIFVIYWFFLQKPPIEQPVVLQPATPEIPDERFNISPSQREEIKMTDTDSQPVDATDDRNPAQAPSVNTDEPTIDPDQKTAIILIGIFGNPDNVKRLIQRIYQAGFEPFTEKAGNLTRIGVELPYKTESDLQKALSDIQRKFEPKARIIKQ